jgi:hypothetical protein
METAVILRGPKDCRPGDPGSGREAVLSRYRRLRAISIDHNGELVRRLSRNAILQCARRLGLALGRTVILDSDDELVLALDLAIHTAPAGRSRSIDRYAKSAPFAAGSDEALVLDAMRQARFAVVMVQRLHEVAGLIVRDVARDEDVWLVDEALEQCADEGMVLATRLLTPEPFSMTAGVTVPLDPESLANVLDALPNWGDKTLREAVGDRRFAAAVYREAVCSALMRRVRYVCYDGEDG